VLGFGAFACGGSNSAGGTGGHTSNTGGTKSEKGTGGAESGSGGSADTGTGGSVAKGTGGTSTVKGTGGTTTSDTGGKKIDAGIPPDSGTATGTGGKKVGIDGGSTSSTGGKTGGTTGAILGGNNGGNPPDLETCVIEDTYDTGNKVCYVDSVGGNDSNDGLTEDKPVKSQAKINSACTVVRYKLGSVFKEKLKVTSKVKVYTNCGPKTDPLPHFIVDSKVKGAGPVAQTNSPCTIDGLRLSGARWAFQPDSKGITAGICGGLGIFITAATQFLNNEVDDCDIGIMVGAEKSLVKGNYVHDLYMGIDAPVGVDPNLVGGAEGIFVNASNNEMAYNSFVNCTSLVQWVGQNGDCDGGATEVSLAAGATRTGEIPRTTIS
jgi:hypothetical protein